MLYEVITIVDAETIMVYFASPAARSTFGNANDTGQTRQQAIASGGSTLLAISSACSLSEKMASTCFPKNKIGRLTAAIVRYVISKSFV